MECQPRGHQIRERRLRRSARGRRIDHAHRAALSDASLDGGDANWPAWGGRSVESLVASPWLVALFMSAPAEFDLADVSFRPEQRRYARDAGDIVGTGGSSGGPPRRAMVGARPSIISPEVNNSGRDFSTTTAGHTGRASTRGSAFAQGSSAPELGRVAARTWRNIHNRGEVERRFARTRGHDAPRAAAWRVVPGAELSTGTGTPSGAPPCTG